MDPSSTLYVATSAAAHSIMPPVMEASVTPASIEHCRNFSAEPLNHATMAFAARSSCRPTTGCIHALTDDQRGRQQESEEQVLEALHRGRLREVARKEVLRHVELRVGSLWSGGPRTWRSRPTRLVDCMPRKILTCHVI